FSILANVRAEGTAEGSQKRYYLERVAIGMSTDVNGRNMVVTSDQTAGADVGLIGRAVMRENDRILTTDFRQIARTRTMDVLDANANFRRNNLHQPMVVRHAILVAPQTGQLTAFVWLLARDGQNTYAVAENVVQMLPPGMHEDRIL